MLRRRPKLLGAVLVAALVAAVGLTLILAFAFVSWIPRFGAGFDPLAPSGLRQLELAASNGRDLARALDVWRAQHTRLPDNLTELLTDVESEPPFRLTGSGAWIPNVRQSDTEVWHYLSEAPHSCVIWRKLGFDSSVEGQLGPDGIWVWWYDPGDGSPATRLPWNQIPGGPTA